MSSVTPHAKTRWWEIDAVRGMAVIGMVIYHALFNAIYFWNLLPFDLSTGIWRAAVLIVQVLFIGLVGVNLQWQVNKRLSALIFQNLKILLLAVLISVGSFILFPHSPIVFGVLHLIGTGRIMAFFLIKRGLNLWPLIAFIFILATLFTQLTGPNWNLVWLGIEPKDFVSLDYFPLIPWLGVMLLGVEVGRWLYLDGLRRFSLPDWSEKPAIRVLTWIGRNSLALYMLHQPLMWLGWLAYTQF